jgi:predicted ester cyclase
VEPIVATMRRFAVDFFTAHNLDVCADIMSADYELTVGRTVIRGRDEQYVAAVERQLRQFPGLAMTVHDLVVTPNRAALYFSEHGASGGAKGPEACWSGIALYEFDGSKLTRCIANEDYAARRRQLKGGVCDPVSPPAAAAWDCAAGSPNAEAEAVVRQWLCAEGSANDPNICFDDEHLGIGEPLALKVTEADVLDIFSSDSNVAFAVIQTVNAGAELFSTGIVSVRDGQVISGRIIRDRQTLSKSQG